jgi:hypothetical protein
VHCVPQPGTCVQVERGRGRGGTTACCNSVRTPADARARPHRTNNHAPSAAQSVSSCCAMLSRRIVMFANTWSAASCARVGQCLFNMPGARAAPPKHASPCSRRLHHPTCISVAEMRRVEEIPFLHPRAQLFWACGCGAACSAIRCCMLQEHSTGREEPQEIHGA